MRLLIWESERFSLTGQEVHYDRGVYDQRRQAVEKDTSIASKYGPHTPAVLGKAAERVL